MAEIGASHRVWPGAKHQLCWWHQREAVRRRLKGNLPTSVYNTQRAAEEYAFIDVSFKPYGRTDPGDSEGGVPGEIGEEDGNEKTTIPLSTASNDPNSIKIRIRRNLLDTTALLADARECIGVPALTDNCPGSLEPSAHSANVTNFTIRIPAPSTNRDSVLITRNEPGPDEEITERRTFCPLELRDIVVGMMERHFCAHPLIPGYSFPSPEGIKAWAVKQIYELCVQNDLPNLWAYLWENWYRRGRWELWARSGNPVEIPRLKTTMLVEGQ